MNRKISFGVLAAMAFSSACAMRASGAFVVENNPSWTRPANGTQASSTLTTYQAWAGFDTTQSPGYQNPANDPNSINPNGTSVAFDSAYPGDGAFFVGSDIYSPTGVISPQVNIPQYNVTGQQLNVTAQVQYFGGDIDLSDLVVTYTDASNVQHSVQADTLANYSVTNLFSTQIDVGFGLADQADYLWTFTVPNTSAVQLNWGWDAESSAVQDIAVDTQSVAVPEPGTTGIILAGLAGVLLRRRGRSIAAGAL